MNKTIFLYQTDPLLQKTLINSYTKEDYQITYETKNAIILEKEEEEKEKVAKEKMSKILVSLFSRSTIKGPVAIDISDLIIQDVELPKRVSGKAVLRQIEVTVSTSDIVRSTAADEKAIDVFTNRAFSFVYGQNGSILMIVLK